MAINQNNIIRLRTLKVGTQVAVDFADDGIWDAEITEDLGGGMVRLSLVDVAHSNYIMPATAIMGRL